jgi:hypothetical protein
VVKISGRQAAKLQHYNMPKRLRGPLAGLFQVLLHWLLQKPCQTPNKKTASKLKPWRSHFAICTTEVKPKIVASRGFFPTCDIEATTTAILPNTLQNDFSFTKKVILLE